VINPLVLVDGSRLSSRSFMKASRPWTSVVLAPNKNARLKAPTWNMVAEDQALHSAEGRSVVAPTGIALVRVLSGHP